MPRCDYDVVFYRVFCITLLGVAFAFTVILTNVFIDIDGLLYDKGKDKTPPNLEHVKSEYEVISRNYQPEYDDYDYPDTERSKRSLESSEFLQDVKDAKLKKFLRSHFSKYFEPFNFDDETTTNNSDSNETTTKKEVNETENLDLLKDIQRLKERKDKKDNEMLHLAIHNIVLQGIIGHMDMKDVYTKAHVLAKHLEESANKDKFLGENKLINEIMDCKELQNEIMKESFKKVNNNTRRTRDKKNKGENRNNRNIFIKTLINITSLLNDQANQVDAANNIDSNLPPEEISGMIKLIYNGRELKFKKMETTTTKPDIKTTETNPYISKSYLNNILKDYLKHFAEDADEDNVPQSIRLKRQVKEPSTTKAPRSNEDDELFVEIETHVGTKGMKGEKKKKMIRDLVDKIQKALHSEQPQNIKKKHKNLHVKKRMQNPLDKNDEWIHSIIHPEAKFLHRQLHPISKSVPVHENLPYMADQAGQNWKKFYSGPHFLDHTKGINSAEMSEVETIYDKVPDSENKIPKRLQLPLMNEEPNYFYNKLGNLRFLVKDIEGSGFSIGYNQYTDEAPDPDSMKLFTGLENVIQSYHRKYDENENELNNQEVDHDIVRRSIKDTDYHSNEYKIIFNNNFLPYNNYHDITNQKIFKKKAKNFDKSLVLDDSLFNKNLKPAEILSLANFFGRRKRSVKVRKISNIKLNKKRVNRYLNTKAMAQRSLFAHKKRNKRQIDKIRIIARDMTPKKSEEEFFVVSDENNYGDRPVIKHNIVQIPQDSDGEKYSEHYEVITPQNPVDTDHIDVLTPYMFEPQKENAYDIFSKISRQNSLMSKYPHIFLDDLNRRNDDDDQIVVHSHNDIPINYGSLTQSTTLATVDTEYYPQNMPKPILNDYTSLLEMPESHDPSKKNYKVTIKITPKNSSVHEGFKEIHTSVNKSYNQNGMIYTSMLNVSELSKVEQAKQSQGDIEALRQRDDQIKQIKINNLNKLKEEHVKIKKFIDIHKNRLEEQLKMINLEKDKIDKLYQNDEILLSQHFMNATKEFDEIPDTTVTVQPVSYTVTTVKPTVTTKKQQHNTEMNKNEKVTNEILSRINKNNDLLQTFLEKIINKLDSSTTTTKKPKTTISTTKMPKMTEIILPEPYEQLRKIFFKNSPLDIKNDSMAVPFIYMYQHPTNVSQEPANILYQGHIHSDLLHKMNKQRDIETIARRSINNKPKNKQYIPKTNNVPKPFKNIGKPFNNAPVSFNNLNNNINTINNNNNLNKRKFNNKLNMLAPFTDNSVRNNLIKQFKNIKKLEGVQVKNDTRFFIDDLENEYKPLQNIDNKLQKN